MKLFFSGVAFDNLKHFVSIFSRVHADIFAWALAAIKGKPGPKSGELFTLPRLKRCVRKFSIPGEAERILVDRLKRLRWAYVNEREYIESLIAYDLWAEKEHLLTGPAFQSREDRSKLWEEIIRDYGKPDKTGSFFEHRLDEVAKERDKTKK
jgi:hypothetical protein